MTSCRERHARLCVNETVAIRSDRLRILRSLWIMGAAVLCRIVLYVALLGTGAYALIGASGFLLDFNSLPWFRLSVLIWAPSAIGLAIGEIMRQTKALWLREGRPPNLEIVAGWSVGGLGMSEMPSMTNTAGVFMVFGGMLAASLAPLALAIEFIAWVTSGGWPTVSIANGLALPFSICLFVAGLLLSVEGLNLGDRSFRRNAAWFSIR